MSDAAAARGDIAVSGLAVMGQNLVLNLERNGFNVVVHNRTTSRMTDFVAGARRQEADPRRDA